MPAPAAQPSRACAMLSETHCPTRAERSGPKVAPCQTSPTPARGVPRLSGRRHAGNLFVLATCNAARSSTCTGFAGIAAPPASSTWAYFRAAPFYGVQKLRTNKGQPAGQPFYRVRKPQPHGEAPIASDCSLQWTRAGRASPSSFRSGPHGNASGHPQFPPSTQLRLAPATRPTVWGSRRHPSRQRLPCLRVTLRPAICPCPRRHHEQRANQPIAANVEAANGGAPVVPPRRAPRCGQRLHYVIGKSVHHAALDFSSRRLPARPSRMPSTPTACLSM